MTRWRVHGSLTRTLRGQLDSKRDFVEEARTDDATDKKQREFDSQLSGCKGDASGLNALGSQDRWWW